MPASVLFKKLVPRLIISNFSPSMGCSEKPDLGSEIDGLPHFSRVHTVYIIHFNQSCISEGHDFVTLIFSPNTSSKCEIMASLYVTEALLLYSTFFFLEEIENGFKQECGHSF